MFGEHAKAILYKRRNFIGQGDHYEFEIQDLKGNRISMSVPYKTKDEALNAAELVCGPNIEFDASAL